jgi:hypothetical protein
MVYAFTNPAAADLVDRIEDWPGATSFQATLSGGQLTATRPAHFFREDGAMPEVVTLPIHRPNGFEDLAPDAWAKLVEQSVRTKEATERQRRIADGIGVLGRQRILNQRPFDCPKTHEPRFQMNPRVASKNKWTRIEALRRSSGFIEKYRDALLRYVAGAADVIFPFGTYFLRKVARVACEAADELAAACS